MVFFCCDILLKYIENTFWNKVLDEKMAADVRLINTRYKGFKNSKLFIKWTMNQSWMLYFISLVF